jgi:hypothetical protein
MSTNSQCIYIDFSYVDDTWNTWDPVGNFFRYTKTYDPSNSEISHPNGHVIAEQHDILPTPTFHEEMLRKVNENKSQKNGMMLGSFQWKGATDDMQNGIGSTKKQRIEKEVNILASSDDSRSHSHENPPPPDRRETVVSIFDSSHDDWASNIDLPRESEHIPEPFTVSGPDQHTHNERDTIRDAHPTTLEEEEAPELQNTTDVNLDNMYDVLYNYAKLFNGGDITVLSEIIEKYMNTHATQVRLTIKESRIHKHYTDMREFFDWWVKYHSTGDVVDIEWKNNTLTLIYDDGEKATKSKIPDVLSTFVLIVIVCYHVQWYLMKYTDAELTRKCTFVSELAQNFVKWYMDTCGDAQIFFLYQRYHAKTLTMPLMWENYNEGMYNTQVARYCEDNVEKIEEFFQKTPALRKLSIYKEFKLKFVNKTYSRDTLEELMITTTTQPISMKSPQSATPQQRCLVTLTWIDTTNPDVDGKPPVDEQGSKRVARHEESEKFALVIHTVLCLWNPSLYFGMNSATHYKFSVDWYKDPAGTLKKWWLEYSAPKQ